MQRGSVLSAYCKCEGGRDGGCKHIAAAMYYICCKLFSEYLRRGERDKRALSVD